MRNLGEFYCKMKHLISGRDKYAAEVSFWSKEIQAYERWYLGETRELYGLQSPLDLQKKMAKSLKDSAVLTWFELHQKPKYLHDLELGSDEFRGEKVLDIGSGPFPSALAFRGCSLYCLDPLFHKYLEAGFPIHYYDNVKFIHAFSEEIPVEDNFFDAVISVNAIDHVDDLRKTAHEISRVLKPGGKLAMHVHYHKATVSEPLEINDAIYNNNFNWCEGLRKISESNCKFGYVLQEKNEKYALWKNF